MDDLLFKIESWRGMWFYKCGSRYTGPYTRRREAEEAVRNELKRAAAPETIEVPWTRGTDPRVRPLRPVPPENPCSRVDLK